LNRPRNLTVEPLQEIANELPLWFVLEGVFEDLGEARLALGYLFALPSSKFRLQTADCGARLDGEQKAKTMAVRPDFSPDEVLSRERLMEVRQNFAKLSTPSLQQAYSEALERCKLGRRGQAPASIHIQVLVQAWKQLRRAR
jgi:hypothetical protein